MDQIEKNTKIEGASTFMVDVLIQEYKEGKIEFDEII